MNLMEVVMSTFKKDSDDGNTKTIHKSGYDRNDGSFRRDVYDVDKNTGQKEHTWVKVSPESGEHKEGWHGKDNDKGSNEPSSDEKSKSKSEPD
jgi:hypothetical protein